IFLVISIGLKAQEAGSGYEYTTISGTLYNKKIFITTNNNEEKIDIAKDSKLSVELIKKVEEYSKQGWQLFNVAPIFYSTTEVAGHVYYLKRKIK
ncbi:MAG TPA: hypothetical protein VGB95_04560, partial [Chitinophagales bacterium]